jgi:hypothetical protein
LIKKRKELTTYLVVLEGVDEAAAEDSDQWGDEIMKLLFDQLCQQRGKSSPISEKVADLLEDVHRFLGFQLQFE